MDSWNAGQARAIAERERIHAFVATAPCNVAYATGFWTPGAFHGIEPCYAVIPVERSDVRSLIAFRACIDQAVDLKLVNIDVQLYGRFFYYRDKSVELSDADGAILAAAQSEAPETSALDLLAGTLKKRGLEHGVIALDEKGVTIEQFRHLQESLPGAKWRTASGLFREIRAIKNPDEVQLIKEVALITESAIHKALGSASVGVTEVEIARRLTTEMVGNDSVPAWLAIGFGTKSAYPNSTPSSRQLCRGDVIRFDVGAQRRLYYSDLARIGSLGEPPTKAIRYYEALLSGQQAALNLIKPGVPVRDLFRAAVETVRSHGIAQYSRNSVGHGIGIEFYDEPPITADSSAVLEQGMVLNVETPYYELGFAGLQTEDTVVVTETGFEFLTSGQRPLYRT